MRVAKMQLFPIARMLPAKGVTHGGEAPPRRRGNEADDWRGVICYLLNPCTAVTPIKVILGGMIHDTVQQGAAARYRSEEYEGSLAIASINVYGGCYPARIFSWCKVCTAG